MKKRKPIILQRLSKDSVDLLSMLADLCGKSEIGLEGIAPERWSRPFAAIGKCNIAPRIRLE